MKIATWNIERLKPRKRLPLIVEEIAKANPDILVLTEADSDVNLPHFTSKVMTAPLCGTEYRPTEHRTIIYSKYKLIESRGTYDDKTAICPVFETPDGPLAVYGTIIGIHGNRRPSFQEDLEKQLFDYARIAKEMSICIAGDFNISFSDNYYFTKGGRDSLNECCERNNFINLTAKLPEAIDHIVVSESFVNNRPSKLTEWNLDKSLSDHKGVCVELVEPFTL